MRKIMILLTVIFILSSCSYDKILTGTYYIKHNNSVEEYIIVKPDSTFTQFLINGNTVINNKNIYFRNKDQNEDDYIFKNYVNGFDPPYDNHPSNQSSYELLATFTATIAGKGQIIIEYNMDIYATKISQSYNSDSVLVEIKEKLK